MSDSGARLPVHEEVEVDGTRLTEAQRTQMIRSGAITGLLSFITIAFEALAYIYFHRNNLGPSTTFHLLAYTCGTGVVCYVLAKTFSSKKYVVLAAVSIGLLLAVWASGVFVHAEGFRLVRALVMLAVTSVLLASVFFALFQMLRAKLLLTARGEYLERKIVEYETATKALEASERKYRALVEAFPHPVILVDNDVVVYANPSAYTQFRCEAPEGLLGRTWEEAITESEQDRVRTLTEAWTADAQTEPEAFQTVMRRLDGTEFPALMCARLLSYGTETFIQAVIVDMTQYEENQRAIRESEQRLRTVLEATSDGVYDKDIVTGKVYHSPAWSMMLGFEPQEIEETDAPLWRLLHPHDLTRVSAANEADLASGAENINAEFRMATKNGEWKWVLSRARVIARDADGRPLRIIGTHTDITGLKEAEETLRKAYAEVEARVTERTASLREANRRLEAEIVERQRAEQAVRESEQHYRNLIDGLSDAVYLVKIPSGTYIYMSPSSVHVLGYSPERILADPHLLENAIHPDSKEAYDNLWRALHNGLSAPSVFEYRIVDEQGEERWVRESMRVVRDADGMPVGVEGIARNVTEERLAQQTVSELRTSVMESARLSMLGEISANVAHEINNPLAIISGSAEQILNAIQQVPAVRPEIITRLADSLMRNTLRIREMVKGLRNLSRDAANDPFRESSLKSIIEDSVVLCEERFAFHSVALHVGAVPEQLMLECRPTQILEVLVNLLTNALHAVMPLTVRWVQLAVAEQDSHVEISVTDSGPGIPADILPRIFEAFVTSRPGGTGLGLSICRRIVTGHSGTILVNAESPHTCFVVRLPYHQ